MIPQVKNLCDDLLKQFNSISPERKILLEKIANYISTKRKENKQVNLVYICSHNSRRSHFGQIWAQTAAAYFNIKNVNTFSGGTEVTAFNPNAIKALENVGFAIKKLNEDPNPVYEVAHDLNSKPGIYFSKVYDDQANPKKEFAAIMVCGEADTNCPFVPGVEFRIVTTYEDPKDFDNTPLQDEKYNERFNQIGIETLYVFSNVK